MDAGDANPLRDAVEKRLLALDRNPFDAARKAVPPLERSYINDLLEGRKKSVRDDKIPQLASALDWTVEELNAARATSSDARAGPQVVGASNTSSADIARIPERTRELLVTFAVEMFLSVRKKSLAAATEDEFRLTAKEFLRFFEGQRAWKDFLVNALPDYPSQHADRRSHEGHAHEKEHDQA